MTTDMTIFEIKVGDKVIRKDGLIGKFRCELKIGIVNTYLT